MCADASILVCLNALVYLRGESHALGGSAKLLTYSNLSEGLLSHVQGSVKLPVKGSFVSRHILVKSLLIRVLCYVRSPPGLCFCHSLFKSALVTNSTCTKPEQKMPSIKMLQLDLYIIVLHAMMLIVDRWCKPQAHQKDKQHNIVVKLHSWHLPGCSNCGHSSFVDSINISLCQGSQHGPSDDAVVHALGLCALKDQGDQLLDSLWHKDTTSSMLQHDS